MGQRRPVARRLQRLTTPLRLEDDAPYLLCSVDSDG
jgi:hypothetical protein